MTEGALRVLLVDDDEDEFVLTGDLLQEAPGARYTLTWAQSYQRGLEALTEDSHDVCLLDFRLGESTGLELMAEARRRGARLPFVLLTGMGSREVDLEAQQAGAADYLPKGGLTAALLDRTLRYAVHRTRDLLRIAEQEAHAARLEEQLLQAQKMETVGQLTSGIAHDFNNVLTVIRIHANFLTEDLRQGEGAAQLQDAVEILRAGTRGAALTRRLLGFGRRAPSEPRPLDAALALEEMERMLKRVLGGSVELATEVSDTPAMVHADPGHLEQILLNLALNARDAMPGGGRLTLRASMDGAGPDALVLLEVEDTGHGMDEGTRARIYEPFFTTKDRLQGSGLGLSMVHGLVQDLGGTIEVESEPGRGTCFSIRLPRAAPDTSSPSEEEPGQSLRGTESVLVLDDDVQVRALAGRSLAHFGYQPLLASDLGEARQLLEEPGRTVDMLVCDVVMPQMQGPVVAELLRKVRPGLPVLFVSGHFRGPEDLLDGPLEHSAFLPKPFTPPELAAMVRRVLDQA